MNTRINTRTRWTFLAAVSASLVLTAVTAHGQMTIIMAENFGGDGSGGLDATGADTFAAGITSAGGSDTWAAGAAFLDDGTVNVDGAQNAAYLNLGTYIDDAKGTATGQFDLTMNISETVGAWISLGFTTQNTPSPAKNFTNTGSGAATTGIATVIRRSAGDADAFAGPLTAGGIAGPVPTGTRTLTVSLDFTPAGGWNGTTNHGTVTFSDSISGPIGSHTYTADNSFGALFISEANSSGGTIGALTLSQATGGADTTDPTLSATDPADDATNVPFGADLVATFDEAIQAGTGSITLNKTIGDVEVESFAVASSGQITLGTNTVTIDPTNDLEADIEYYVLIDAMAVKDMADNPYAGITVAGDWSFTTLPPDTTAPTKSAMGPAADATGVPTGANLALTFDEDVQLGTGNIEIKLAADDSVVEMIDVTTPGAVVINGASVTIVRSVVLGLGTAYYVNIDTGAFEDLAGNDFAGIAGTTTWAFTTWAVEPLVAENFGGTGDPLNGTDADAFGAAITAAGGSATWAAGGGILDNGTVNVDGGQNAASLNLGTYIDDTAGTADGKFVLTMTISETVGEWISLGFSTLNTPSTTQNFTHASTNGMATIIRREIDDWDLDMFSGPALSGTSIPGPEPTDPGPRTLTVTLDLTPAGGYDGSTNFGTVTWSDSVLGDLPGGSFTYTSAQTFGAILISEAGSSGGTVSALSLTQESVGGAAPLELKIAQSGGSLEFEWNSLVGMQYDLVSNTDLLTTPDTWLPYDDGNMVYENIANTGTTTTLSGVLKVGTTRFFALIEEEIPPIFSEDFEGGGIPADWAAVVTGGTGTAWEVGTPTDSDSAATGPSAAANGAQCAGTNISADYTSSVDVSLRSKAFTVPATGATLNFSQYVDTDKTGVPPDVGSIRLLNAGDDSVLVGGDVAVDLEGDTETWTSESIDLPVAAYGLSVKLEFRFVSNASDEFAGFYIDDVEVNAN